MFALKNLTFFLESKQHGIKSANWIDQEDEAD